MLSRAAVAEEFRASAHLLEAALWDDEEGDVLNELLLNRAQLWRTTNSALLTRLCSDGGENYCLLWKAGGRLDELMSLGPLLISWARQQGATRMRIRGRKGWVRVMAKAWGADVRGNELWKAI